ncbi:MAG TPA: phosphoadenylyl-sulfate reductase [Polyangiaceae bacterium]|nr:phosphoadenylyl-sulfate reductase [Polyangiaceae bacterium]
MHVTMVKKVLLDGSPCKKCDQAEELFKRRGLWEKIDEVVWAKEAEPDSPGMRLAERHRVELAPFFIVRDDAGEKVYTSAVELMREKLSPKNGAPSSPPSAGGELTEEGIVDLNQRFARAEPVEMIDWLLGRFGERATIAFSGAEDVSLIELASQTKKPFSVTTLDTGRLHPETYRFIDKVRSHYGVAIHVVSPDRLALETLVRKKGLFSFYEEGHGECCGIRKLEPLGRALSDKRGWITGQRRDQSPTRTDVAHFELDRAHAGTEGPLIKLNPLAAWSLADTWTFLRDRGVPTNELHERGYVSVGCEPCTRALRPGEHERAARWWWEEATKRECGLHTRK